MTEKSQMLSYLKTGEANDTLFIVVVVKMVVVRGFPVSY